MHMFLLVCSALFVFCFYDELAAREIKREYVCLCLYAREYFCMREEVLFFFFYMKGGGRSLRGREV